MSTSDNSAERRREREAVPPASLAVMQQRVEWLTRHLLAQHHPSLLYPSADSFHPAYHPSIDPSAPPNPVSPPRRRHRQGRSHRQSHLAPTSLHFPSSYPTHPPPPHPSQMYQHRAVPNLFKSTSPKASSHLNSAAPFHTPPPVPLYSSTTPPSASLRPLPIATGPPHQMYRDARSPVSGRSTTSDDSGSSSDSSVRRLELFMSPRGPSPTSSLEAKRPYPSLRAAPYTPTAASPSPKYVYPGQEKTGRGRRKSSKMEEEEEEENPGPAVPYHHTSNSARSLSRLTEGARQHKAAWYLRGPMPLDDSRLLVIPPH